MNENNLDPMLVLKLIAKDVPRELHENLLIVGSLAAAYHYREDRGQQPVKTKDADVIIQPAGALAQCRDIAERLLDAKWKRTERCRPWNSPEPLEDLRLIRLHPPDSELYFIEFLGLPLPDQQDLQRWEPCQLRDGWYVVPCFRYMAVLAQERKRSEFGIEYASPALMALANMLSHATLGTSTIGETNILRSSKDLGRALALHRLAPYEELNTWPATWWNALQHHFPAEAMALAKGAGKGIRALLDDSAAFNDAFVLTSGGLLSGKNVSPEQLRIEGERLLNDTVRELYQLAGA